jgi:hypothetical protein
MHVTLLAQGAHTLADATPDHFTSDPRTCMSIPLWKARTMKATMRRWGGCRSAHGVVHEKGTPLRKTSQFAPCELLLLLVGLRCAPRIVYVVLQQGRECHLRGSCLLDLAPATLALLELLELLELLVRLRVLLAMLLLLRLLV